MLHRNGDCESHEHGGGEKEAHPLDPRARCRRENVVGGHVIRKLGLVNRIARTAKRDPVLQRPTHPMGKMGDFGGEFAKIKK
jgi:hypothetical protein